MASKTTKRKASHIEVCLRRNVVPDGVTNGLEDVRFVHEALPQVDFGKIEISSKIFGKKLKAPFIIEAMTGGHPHSEKINRSLAEAAQETGIAMGLGSQRAMLENSALSSTYQVRKAAPDIPLIGNIGIAQLREYKTGQISSALSKIDADALAVHLNPLQEAVQAEGDTSLAGSLVLLRKLCSELSVPVIAKETGAGISAETAQALQSAGVSMIDVSGLGGTSWSLVESYRSNKPTVFGSWGIPTAQSIIEASSAVSVPIIASGGIKNGLEAAKCLALGASYAGSALKFLKVLDRGGTKGLISEIEGWKRELKTAMFLSGSKNLAELSHARLVVSGPTARAIKARGLCAKK